MKGLLEFGTKDGRLACLGSRQVLYDGRRRPSHKSAFVTHAARLCVALWVCGVWGSLWAARAGEALPPADPPVTANLPRGVWDSARAEKLELALDGFFAEPAASKRTELFEKELLPQQVGLRLEDMEVIAKAAPPAGERRGQTQVWRVPCPWLKGNPRGWFNFSMPRGYTPAKSWGLAVALHGSATDGDNLPSFYSPQLNDLGYFVLFPTTMQSGHFWSKAEEMAHVYRLVEWAGRNYRLDFRRVVITGGSMGGMGTWSHLLARPELWSAGASVAGHPAALQGEILERLRGVPFYILHGEKDTKDVSMAPVENVRKAVAELKKRRLDCVYVEAPGAAHTPPVKFWQEMNEWIAKQAPKAFSPRPLFLPPPGKRPLWQAEADPLGWDDDPAAGLIREGRGKDARALLDARIAKNRDDGGALLLRALAQVPALAEPLSEKLDPKEFKDEQKGWGRNNEEAALRDLESALRAGAGKGASIPIFDATARLMSAKIWAKRFAVLAGGGSFEWVEPYKNYLKEVQEALTLDPNQAEAINLLQSVNAKVPKPKGNKAK